ncbi:MAG TPA: hypothetical protein VJL28_04345 [Gemmatimonadaceae bacterium]|nr:hypothetical protein [Gemmatimonadaceae bacterium]
MSVARQVLQLVKAHHDVQTLSVYVDGSATDPAERHHWRVALENELARVRASLHEAMRAEREAFEACAGRLLQELPPAGAMLGAHGWAGFSSVSGDVHTEALPSSVPTSVSWERGFRILPYLAAADPGPAIVVVADQHRAVIHALAGLDLRELEVVESHPHVEVGPHMGSTPRQGFHPGTRGEARRDAAERQTRSATDRFIAEAAGRVRMRAGDRTYVLLGGAAEAVARLAGALPETLAARTSIASALHADATPAVILRLAREALATARAGRQRQLVSDLVDRAGQQGRAALGREAVARALELGAVDLLLLSSAALSHEAREAEALVRAALAEGADVEVLTDVPGALLDAEAGGAAARLRFSTRARGAPRSRARGGARPA